MAIDGTDRSELTDYGKYAEGAIGQGRPEATCECPYCEGCTLPTYEPGDGCVWCRNGEHCYDDTESNQ